MNKRESKSKMKDLDALVDLRGVELGNMLPAIVWLLIKVDRVLGHWESCGVERSSGADRHRYDDEKNKQSSHVYLTT